MSEIDALVVGGGIAGLTAATMLARQGYSVTIADDLCGGGRLMNLGQVVAYPGVEPTLTGPEVAARCLDTALDAGVTMLPMRVTALEQGSRWRAAIDGAQEVIARAVILATGRSADLAVVPGAAALAGRGFSQCASCDGPLFTGQEVTITGSSRWLTTEAEHLASLAATVTVVDVGSTFAEQLVALSALPNVRVVNGSRIVRVDDDEQGLRAIFIEDRDGATERIPARALFLCDDQMPQVPAGLLPGSLDPSTGAIVTIDDVRTTTPGLFAAGDVRAGSAPFLVSAASDGLRAALALDVYLREQAG